MIAASEGSLDVEPQIIETGLPLRRESQSVRWLGLNTVYNVASALAAAQAGDSDAWLESAYHLSDVMNTQQYAVTREMALSVSEEVLSGIAELQPANSWQKHRAEAVRKLYEQIREQAQSGG